MKSPNQIPYTRTVQCANLVMNQGHAILRHSETNFKMMAYKIFIWMESENKYYIFHSTNSSFVYQTILGAGRGYGKDIMKPKAKRNQSVVFATYARPFNPLLFDLRSCLVSKSKSVKRPKTVIHQATNPKNSCNIASEKVKIYPGHLLFYNLSGDAILLNKIFHY